VSVVASSLDSPVTMSGSVVSSFIGDGRDNSISVSAVGASAQLAVNDVVSGGSTFTRMLDVNGEIAVYAENSGAVTLQTDFDAPRLSGGTRNTISGNAIGSSAAVSVSAMVYDGAYEADIAIGSGNAINVTAFNSGDVTIGSTDDPTEMATMSGATATADSVDGSISLMAIGASGSVSSSDVVYSGSAIPSVAFGDVNFDVQNSGTVQANVEISDASLEGSNRISAGAVGVTNSASTKLINYADNNYSSNKSFAQIYQTSVNTGLVSVNGGMSNLNISGGYNASISIFATGSISNYYFMN
jgi:hypothetical protein